MDKIFIELYGPKDFLDTASKVAEAENKDCKKFNVSREIHDGEERLIISADDHGQFYKLGLKTGLLLKAQSSPNTKTANPKTQQQ